MVNMAGKHSRVLIVVFLLTGLGVGGCASHKPTAAAPPRPDISPPNTLPPPLEQDATVEALKLDASQIKPMYTEMLAIDLPSVVQVASASNFDIRQAHESVAAARGELESTVGALFPAIVPTALFEHVEGTVRATEGKLVGVGFNTFQPSIALQWVINPGRVIYNIIAAKKRLLASEHQEQAVILETLRRSVVQYYDLVLSQARVSAAHQGVMEAQELLRINRLRTRTGTGVLADELRAEARFAQRRQDLILAMKGFYDASVALAVTLHLDSSVTLVPKIDELPPTSLVRDDLTIEELLEIAVTFRPDLQQVRTLVEAAMAEKGSTWWGGLGPQFSAGYRYGGITGQANNVTAAEGIPGNLLINPSSPTGSFSSSPLPNGLIKEGISRGSRLLDGRDDRSYGFRDQQFGSAGLGWRLSASIFGDLKTASAVHKQALIEAQRQLDNVRAQVVSAAQDSRAHHELSGLAYQQVTSAQEALRLSELNLRAGTMTTLDVLQGQDAVTQARLRYAEAVVRYNQSQVNLLAAVGLLDESSLAASDAGGQEQIP